MAFDANKPIKPSGDVLLPAVEEYEDCNGICPFRRVPPEERLYRDARFELGFRKGELLRNIVWATRKSWDQTKPVEQTKAQLWLDAQRAELLKWHERWAGKVDIDRVLREVFYQVSASSNRLKSQHGTSPRKFLDFNGGLMSRIRKSAVNDAARIIKNVLIVDGPQPHTYVAQFLIDRFEDRTIQAAADQAGVMRWLDSKDRIYWALPSWSPTQLEQQEIQ